MTKWTEDNIAQMKKLFSEGLSASAVGNVIGYSRNAVIGKANRLGFKVSDLNHFIRGPKEPLRVRRRLNMYLLEEVKSRPVLRYKPVSTAPVVIRMRPPRKPKEQPVSQCTILELTNHTCHWPLWQGDEHRFYCGVETEGRVYCEKHRLRAKQFHNNAHEYERRDPSRDFVINRRPAKSPKSIVA